MNLSWQLHTFPEGKVNQEEAPIRRLKWGTASLIARARITPIVLPIVHHGFHEVSQDFSAFPVNYISYYTSSYVFYQSCSTVNLSSLLE